MAEFQEVLKERKRMCKDQPDCKTCPIYSANCYEWTIINPESAEKRIIQWAAEHPIKTNRMKFREVFGRDIVIPIGDDSWLDQEYKGGQDSDVQRDT